MAIAKSILDRLDTQLAALETVTSLARPEAPIQARVELREFPRSSTISSMCFMPCWGYVFCWLCWLPGVALVLFASSSPSPIPSTARFVESWPVRQPTAVIP